jgi:hypothetical protein
MTTKRLTASDLEALRERPSDLTVVVTAGIAALEHGQTRLELTGPDKVLVVNRKDGEETRTEGDLAENDTFELLRSLIEVTSRQQRERPGIPDEARYRIEVLKAGQVLAVLEAWEGQLEEDPSASELLQRLRDIVARVTDHKILL